MYEATSDFDFGGQEYRRGVSRVSADHDAYQRHPEMFRFVADGPGGDTRSEIRAHDAAATE
jgi:hypothetical protein